jgi:hypothetical protein
MVTYSTALPRQFHIGGAIVVHHETIELST